MATVKIGKHIIGNNLSPFVVAEAGINHNGDIKKAFEMIHVAKLAGVNAIKFQTFRAHEFISDSKQLFTYKSQGKQVTESMLEMFKRCEFSYEDWYKINKRCQQEKIMFLSTPQNRSDLDLLLELGVPVIKIGSDDFTNLPLLKDYASTKLPLILSCGMSDLSEIFETINSVGAFDGYPIILLYTVSLYPTPSKEVNLLRLKTLKDLFPQIPIGFSDHTQGSLASSLAVSLGACLLEKHFTLSHDLSGPDHWFSEDPAGLQEWVSSIRKSFLMMGNPIIRTSEAEHKMRSLARRSIVALTDIKKGEKFNKKNIGLRRPGNGLPPKMIDHVYGLISTRIIKKGMLIKHGDFQ